MEKTLIILKPDCMEKRLAGKVLARFEEEGFSLSACKMIKLDEKLLRIHYAHHADKPFFPEICAFMSSTPVLVMVLEAENAIEKARELLGPTDSTIAPSGTIRGDMGESKMKNIAHASDSKEAAEAEVKRFFEPEELFDATYVS